MFANERSRGLKYLNSRHHLEALLQQYNGPVAATDLGSVDSAATANSYTPVDRPNYGGTDLRSVNSVDTASTAGSCAPVDQPVREGGEVGADISESTRTEETNFVEGATGKQEEGQILFKQSPTWLPSHPKARFPLCFSLSIRCPYAAYVP